MSKSYATILTRLCHDFSCRKLNFDEYRSRRRILLAKIDEQFNGRSEDVDDNLTSPCLPSGDFGIASFERDLHGKTH